MAPELSRFCRPVSRQLCRSSSHTSHPPAWNPPILIKFQTIEGGSALTDPLTFTVAANIHVFHPHFSLPSYKCITKIWKIFVWVSFVSQVKIIQKNHQHLQNNDLNCCWISAGWDIFRAAIIGSASASCSANRNISTFQPTWKMYSSNKTPKSMQPEFTHLYVDANASGEEGTGKY